MAEANLTRTVLYTGKGGVGKTSVAAATAVRASSDGLKTLILSTDPAHSLSHAFGCEIGDQPTEIGENLWGLEISPLSELERHWSGVRNWFGGFLVEHGIGRITAEELTVPPGMDELFSMLRLSEHVNSNRFDLVVVDCAPTGETLRLLSFPEVAQWWLDRLMPKQNDLLNAARPLASALFNIPLPNEDALGDVRRVMESLLAMNALLRDRENTTVRLVMTPDRMVLDETMRTFTYLNLYGYQTDAVVVNRIFPDETAGSYFSSWHKHQQQLLEQVDSAFSPVPLLKAPFLQEEVIGETMLHRLADELFVERKPQAVLYDEMPQQLKLDDNGATLTLQIPFVEKSEISLHKAGLQLVVRAGTIKRTIILPAKLEHFQPTGASYNNGGLEVRFEHAEQQNSDG